jgi:hypothetical protein
MAVNVLFVLALVAVAAALLRRRRQRGSRTVRATPEEVNRRAREHMTSLVNDGTVAVEEVLRNFDEMVADGTADQDDVEQGLRDFASGLTSDSDRGKIAVHLDQIHH